MGTEFLLLGPLVVQIDGTLVPVPAAKHRAVLAALLLRANHVVTVEDLAEVLWGAGQPSAARVGVQNYVMRLRKALGPAGSRIATQPDGYLIYLEAGELDVDRFESLLREARTAAGNSHWQVAADQASAALALWRGEPLADLGSDLPSEQDGSRLAELRLQAQQLHIEAELQLGRPGEVIGELRQLVAAHPLRERLHGLLMLALYRDSRQAEALAAYQRARDVLVEELGAEPGPDVQQLHRQILTADPVLALPAGPARAGRAAGPVPRELPGDVASFTGREAELAELDRLLLGPADAPGERQPTAAVISAVSGAAGVGKTALAVHWGHRAAHRFPDGQLYVNLRGYDPGQPVAAADALAGFLRSLGVPGQDIPPDESDRAARYRSLLADNRTIVMLDNAASVEQVRPLLPGTSTCAVVVTSRDSLSGIVARDGARRLDLDLLPQADAVALLRELIGARTDVETDATVALAERCARLPLALRVAAELAATRPDMPLASLVAELSDQQQRLDLLSVSGDPRAAVRGVFSWSYDHLEADAARAFRLAGLHPGADFDAYALAALADTGIDQAVRLLTTLTRGHLLQPARQGRYTMHDLLRAYARELAARHDGDHNSRTALTRLLDSYLSTAAMAMDALYPAERHRRPRIPPSSAPAPPVTDANAALARLDAERANLVALAGYAAMNGWPSHATAASALLFRYLDDGAHVVDGVSICNAARHAASNTGDLSAEAEALTCLGTLNWRSSRYVAAADFYRQGLARFRESGERAGQIPALQNLANVTVEQGDYSLATSHYSQALALSGEVGDWLGQANALAGLGVAAWHLGRYREAAAHYRQALGQYRELGHNTGEALALTNLGAIYERLGEYQLAAEHHQEALALARQSGSRRTEANTLNNLGLVEHRRGHYRLAADCQRQALEIFREIGDPSCEAECRNGLGEALLAQGLPGEAEREHSVALRLATQSEHRLYQAHAHDGLGQCRQASRDISAAREYWQQALALYTELGAPEAGNVRARLAALDGDPVVEP